MKLNSGESQGFTLVEVLVALMIAAVALPALLSLVITQMDSAGTVRDIRELQIGDEFKVLDSDYKIVDVRMNPPSVTIERRRSADAAPIRRTLLPHSESLVPEVLVAQSTR